MAMNFRPRMLHALQILTEVHSVIAVLYLDILDSLLCSCGHQHKLHSQSLGVDELCCGLLMAKRSLKVCAWASLTQCSFQILFLATCQYSRSGV